MNTLFYHPELRASGSAGAVFYSQFSSHLTGQFATADRTFKDALRLTDLQRQSADNLLASIKNHLETMKNLDNLQAVNPGDLDIQSDWEAEELELQNDITTWESLILEVKNARQSALLATLSLYEQIIPMEQWEINEKNLSSLVIQQLTQTSTMSATDELNLLRSIAAQCTYTGGEPVSIARSLLPVNEYKAYKAMEEEPECGQDSERSKDVDQENNNNTEITISPNPAGDYFRLNLSEKSDSRLIVTDLMGRVVDSQSAHSEKVINYNTSSWPTGTYQITVIEIGGQVSIVHFTVQH